ncbi:7844_t:CDS:2 [Rhizophagus irregularis]|nr:7844_t:CDS:2 [Rhizophagus irregularis]
MTLEVENLEDGRWLTQEDYVHYVGANSTNINCQPRNLTDNENETISSVTSHFLGGVKGFASFLIHDDMTSKLNISWEVPTIGTPQYEFNFLGELSYQHYVTMSPPISFIIAIGLPVIVVIIIGILVIALWFNTPTRIQPRPAPAGFHTRGQRIRPGPPAEH